jgi:hypothetical protein
MIEQAIQKKLKRLVERAGYANAALRAPRTMTAFGMIIVGTVGRQIN